MASFKTTKKELYATPFDIRLATPQLLTRDVVTDGQLERYLYQAVGIIQTMLINTYTESSFKIPAPWWFQPISKNELFAGQGYKNIGATRLTGLTVGAKAITEQWILEFTSIDVGNGVGTFRLDGTFSGNVGTTGVTNVNFVSSGDADVSIPSANWIIDQNAVVGDQMFFNTYIHHPAIVMICTNLAAAYALRSFMTEASPNSSRTADDLETRSMDLLKMLADPNSQVKLETLPQRNLTPIEVRYDVDDFGRDRSPKGPSEVVPGGIPSGTWDWYFR